jgi:hypothetical protein
MRNFPLYVDLGLEATAVADADRAHLGSSIEVDAALGVFRDPVTYTRVPLHTRIADHVLGMSRPQAPQPWPELAHAALEVRIGILFDLAGGRQQLRMAVGTGLGPIGIALAGLQEFRDGDDAAFLGPELRVRHRFGPRARSPSVGMLVRADLFLNHREMHPDRLSIGVFGMFDVL